MISNVIKFSATWCSPCKQFAPIFDEVSKMEEFKDIVFSHIDIDEDSNYLTEKFSIKSVPTVVILDDENNVVKKIIGMVSKNDFITVLKDCQSWAERIKK